MNTVVRRWGNGLGIKIPKVYYEKNDIRDGSLVELELLDDIILIKSRHKPTLEELLSGVNDDNIHKEVSFGKPEGIEIW
jgi:antitoxin MazE